MDLTQNTCLQPLLGGPTKALPAHSEYMWPFKRVPVIIKIRGSLLNMLWVNKVPPLWHTHVFGTSIHPLLLTPHALQCAQFQIQCQPGFRLQVFQSGRRISLPVKRRGCFQSSLLPSSIKHNHLSATVSISYFKMNVILWFSICVHFLDFFRLQTEREWKGFFFFFI